jgi:signal transduction histidine kinase
MAPVCYRKTNSFPLAAYLTLLPPTVYLFALIWTAGGLDAPGSFWLSTIPLTYAVLLGARASMAGVIAILSFYVASYLATTFGVQPNILTYLPNYDYNFEKLFNYFAFLIYSASTSIFYIQSESAFQTRLNIQKDEIDNLLKILIHDVGNPLTVMGLTLSKLDPNSNNDLNKVKNTLTRSVGNIRLLLNQVKSLRALNDGKTVIELTSVDLSDLIEDLAQEIKPRLESKELALKIDFQHRNRPILADRNVLFHVVLMNLLTNAIKFSHQNGTIELKTIFANNKVGVEIRDYGIGIPVELQKSIFNPYAATSRKGTSGEKGTGFGLPLVKDFAKKLECELELKSSEVNTETFSQGTSISIWFKSPVLKAKTSLPKSA